MAATMIDPAADLVGDDEEFPTLQRLAAEAGWRAVWHHRARFGPGDCQAHWQIRFPEPIGCICNFWPYSSRTVAYASGIERRGTCRTIAEMLDFAQRALDERRRQMKGRRRK